VLALDLVPVGISKARQQRSLGLMASVLWDGFRETRRLYGSEGGVKTPSFIAMLVGRRDTSSACLTRTRLVSDAKELYLVINPLFLDWHRKVSVGVEWAKLGSSTSTIKLSFGCDL